MIQCRWHNCPYIATTQVTLPAPIFWGGKAAIWFCPAHEVYWQVAIGTNLAWVNYDDWAPVVGMGVTAG